MKTKIKTFLKDNIILIFLIFTFFLLLAGSIYYFGLNPSNKNIENIIDKYKTNNYSIPYYVAERYITWYNMRTFFFSLNYILTLLSIFASLMTIFYASNTSNTLNDKNTNFTQEENKKNKYIVFLSLLSMCFTISSIFINPSSMAYMSQHAWRELDTCIIQTIGDTTLSKEQKDKIIIDKVVEMEKYIESYEH